MILIKKLNLVKILSELFEMLKFIRAESGEEPSGSSKTCTHFHLVVLMNPRENKTVGYICTFFQIEKIFLV